MWKELSKRSIMNVRTKLDEKGRSVKKYYVVNPNIHAHASTFFGGGGQPFFMFGGRASTPRKKNSWGVGVNIYTSGVDTFRIRGGIVV